MMAKFHGMQAGVQKTRASVAQKATQGATQGPVATIRNQAKAGITKDLSNRANVQATKSTAVAAKAGAKAAKATAAPQVDLMKKTMDPTGASSLAGKAKTMATSGVNKAKAFAGTGKGKVAIGGAGLAVAGAAVHKLRKKKQQLPQAPQPAQPVQQQQQPQRNFG